MPPSEIDTCVDCFQDLESADETFACPDCGADLLCKFCFERWHLHHD